MNEKELALYRSTRLHRKHFVIDGVKTTLALEQAYWEALEACHGDGWMQWVTDRLKTTPEGCGRARWVRIAFCDIDVGNPWLDESLTVKNNLQEAG